MRTTFILDDDLVAALNEKAERTGRPFEEVVNTALRAGIEAEISAPPKRRYLLEPVSLGGIPKAVDLDKAPRLADALEDAEISRKLELRK